ncbi:MAG: hypothetical protein B7Y99_07720 [Caulobacterales bacterium 32-69-10]|nr:MAG: hypothetical protein B7Y99_07720 [Caulobacterales bacterium 32-69-10]
MGRTVDERVIELFRAAALDGSSWITALDAFAQATGSRSGDLIGVKPGRVVFEWTSNIDPQLWVDLDEEVRADPSLNPRVRAGLASQPLEAVAAFDYASDELTRAFPKYGEACRRYDIGQGALAVLHRSAAGMVGLATLRSAAQGAPTDEQMRTFRRLAPHVLDAVRLRRMVDEQGTQFALGALDAISVCAFLCDYGGQVRGLTPGAEGLVGPDGPLRLKRGRLTAFRDADTEALAAATRRAAELPDQGVQTVVIRDRAGKPLAVEVAALPAQPWSMLFRPRVMLTVKRRPRPPSAEELMSAFGLTLAEADVTLMIARGMQRDRIAAARGVSPGTVKSQLQAIFAKLGVSRESEITVLLSGF